MAHFTFEKSYSISKSRIQHYKGRIQLCTNEKPHNLIMRNENTIAFNCLRGPFDARDKSISENSPVYFAPKDKLNWNCQTLAKIPYYHVICIRTSSMWNLALKYNASTVDTFSQHLRPLSHKGSPFIGQRQRAVSGNIFRPRSHQASPPSVERQRAVSGNIIGPRGHRASPTISRSASYQ